MKFTNRHHLPDYLVSYLQRFYKPEPYRIGVTSLIDEPLQRILLMKHWDELVVDVSDFLNTVKGHGIGQLFEDKLPKIEIEQNGFTIVGKADKIFLKDLIDIKHTSTWVWIYRNNPNSKLLDYEKQLNLYAWMYKLKYHFEFDNFYLDLYFDDWKISKTIQRGNQDYPKILFKRYKVKDWGFETQQQFVEKQLQLHRTALESSNPIECNPAFKMQNPPTWAVMKKGQKSAIRGGVCDSKDAANKMINSHKDKNKLYIEERKSICKRCENYCLVNQFCPYYKGNKKE